MSDGIDTEPPGIHFPVTDGTNTIFLTLAPDKEGKYILQLPEGGQMLPSGVMYAPQLVAEHLRQQAENGGEMSGGTTAQIHTATPSTDSHPGTPTAIYAPQCTSQASVSQEAEIIQLPSELAKDAIIHCAYIAQEAPPNTIYVNPRQYPRILKRREMRHKLETAGRIPRIGTQRRGYLHESRHKHAEKRARGEGGKFDSMAGKNKNDQERKSDDHFETRIKMEPSTSRQLVDLEPAHQRIAPRPDQRRETRVRPIDGIKKEPAHSNPSNSPMKSHNGRVTGAPTPNKRSNGVPRFRNGSIALQQPIPPHRALQQPK